METSTLHIGTLTPSRRHKVKLGSVAMTLFLAGWLNLLVQPCLMAAPVDDCYGSTIYQPFVPASGSAAIYPANGEIRFDSSVDCQSMDGCVSLDGAYAISVNLDPEKKFLASIKSSAQIRPEPAPFSLPLLDPKTCFSRVPLFIQNCAFLI